MMTIGTKWMMTFSIQMMMNNHNHNLLQRIFERAAQIYPPSSRILFIKMRIYTVLLIYNYCVGPIKEEKY